MSSFAQNHLHVVNSSGGEIAKLESTTGFPQMVYSNDHGNIAQIGLEESNNSNAVNDDNLVLKGLKPFSKIRMEVGDGSGVGLITINPTNNTNSAIVGALVGINTDSPSSPLTVTSVQGGVTSEFRTGQTETYVIWTANAGSMKQKGFAGFFDDTNNMFSKDNFRIGTPDTNPNGALDFRTNNENRMTIKNTGQVFVGDFSSFATTVISSPSALNVCGDIKASGTIQTLTTLCSSDVRFKRDVESLENPLDNILNLNGVSYHWNTDVFTKRGFTEDKQIGLIAQEVEEVLPELVQTDADGYKSVDYQSLSAVLIEAIKEQQKAITSLEKRIALLEE